MREFKSLILFVFLSFSGTAFFLNASENKVVTFEVKCDINDRYEIFFPVPVLLNFNKHTTGTKFDGQFSYKHLYTKDVLISILSFPGFTQEDLAIMMAECIKDETAEISRPPLTIKRSRFFASSYISRCSTGEKRYSAIANIYMDRKFLIRVEIKDISHEDIDVLLDKIYDSFDASIVRRL